MPKRRVERASRTAFPSAVDAPGPAPRPGSDRPGADRRAAHRPGIRWALRALVIGALAGTAWLLTGAAAQAAGHDPTVGGALTDSSLTDAAQSGDTTEPAVTGFLQAAAQPLDPDRRGSTLDLPDRAVTRPVATVAQTIGEAAQQWGVADVNLVADVDLAADGVGRVGWESIGTLRLTGGSVYSRLTPVKFGSQAPAGGGSAAFLPAEVAAGTVAVHRTPNSADVDIRRNDAEAPTVSPD
jgi:hypothetical protein